MRLVKRTVQLTPFRISNGALQTKDLPRRIKLLNWGRNDTVKGPVFVTEFTAAAMPLNQKALGLDRVALDYEHNTVPGTETFKSQGEPRKVAAYGVPQLVVGEGLFLDDLQYTPSGMEYSREYCDLSPAPKLNAKGEVEYLHSVALCRAGAVVDLSFFSMDEGDENGVLMQPQPQEEMEFMDRIMALLRKALGLKDDAGEQDVVAAIQTLTAFSQRIAALEGLTAEDGRVTVLNAGVDGLKAQIGDLDVRGKITSLMADLDAVRKDLICYQARVDGKIVPLSAEQLKETPVDTLKDMVAKIDPTVPVTPLTAVATKEHKGIASTQHSDIDKAVAKACGVTLK